MTESGAARPGDSQGRNRLHENLEEILALADKAYIGNFGRHSQFDAYGDADNVAIRLQVRRLTADNIARSRFGQPFSALNTEQQAAARAAMQDALKGVDLDDAAIARAVHVLAVVLWIGGVGFVATVLLPAIRRLRAPEERLAYFDKFERRFSWQARITTGVTGLSGLYMLIRFDLWDRFRFADFWWMHAMVVVWLLFTVMLFAAEPLFLHRWLERRAMEKPEASFRLVEWFHWALLLLSAITILGAVAGSHGLTP